MKNLCGKHKARSGQPYTLPASTQHRVGKQFSLANGNKKAKMDKAAEELQAKGFKGFASLAQAKRCDSLVKDGLIVKEIYERDLLATDIESLPWRKGPAKDGDPSTEEMKAYSDELMAARSVLVEAYNQSQDQGTLKPV